jgi:outer membrane autotransporter protein
MRKRPLHAIPNILASSFLWLGTVMLFAPGTAWAQQSLADRLIPILQGGICNQVTDAALGAAACVGGFPANEGAEVSVQLSGNAAAAAGSNASQTTIAQVDAQSARLVEVRAQAPVANGMRSGSDGGESSQRIGGFLNAFGGFGDTELNGEEPGFEYDGGGFTAGLDVLMNDHFVVGGGFGWNRQSSDYDTVSSVVDGSQIGGGDLQSDSYVFSIFGSWFDGPLYVDAMLSYTYVEYEAERNIIIPSFGENGTVDSDTDAHQAGFTLGSGYQLQFHGLTIGPVAQMNYLYTMIEGYDESGFASFALSYEDQDIETLTTSFGAEISYPVSLNFGVITPHFRMTWEHELMDDPRKIRASFILDDSGNGNAITTETGEPDRNYGRLAVGAAAQLKAGVSTFIEYETLLGLAHTEAHRFTAGGRIEF